MKRKTWRNLESVSMLAPDRCFVVAGKGTRRTDVSSSTVTYHLLRGKVPVTDSDANDFAFSGFL